ncbi:MAG: hypothetical protein LBH00_09565 [Planctomycetaceae bacterium]|jgi:hypothetical protein|nr:hypothetical protein [Planctomycetaceae bacterium]
MKHILFMIALIILVTLTGCSGNAPVDGTVKFEDGTPLMKGSVVFANASQTFFGSIQQDGHYSAGAGTGEKGLPPGTYTVCLGNVNVSSGLGIPAEILVDPQFCSAETSGWVYESTGKGKQTFDLTVKRAKPEQQIRRKPRPGMPPQTMPKLAPPPPR